LDYLRIARDGCEQHIADLFGTRREVFETPYRFIWNRRAQTAIKYYIVNIARDQISHRHADIGAQAAER
jgi:hypothetical protein